MNRQFRLLAAFAAVVVAVGLIGAGYVLAARTSENTTTTLALCALKDDLQRRVKASKDYLAENPHGAPGIPAKTIQDGIRNQQRTINALHILKCPD